MSDIQLVRIDNRLIHGQVAKQWVKDLGANVVIVANDEVANDELRQQLMNMAAPANAQTRYFTVAETPAEIEKLPDDANVFVIVENPDDAVALVEAGAPVKKVNVGNMHMSEGKKQISTTVAIDDADKAAFQKLADKGVALEIQRTPGVAKEDATALVD